jgi:hypothetical protein
MKLLATPLNGLCVMLAEYLATVNFKNRSLSRNSMYEEKRSLAFHMATGGAPPHWAMLQEQLPVRSRKAPCILDFRAIACTTRSYRQIGQFAALTCRPASKVFQT